MAKDRYISALGRLVPLLATIFVFAVLGSLILNPGRAVVKGARSLPVPLHSALQADYSTDPQAYPHSLVELDLIAASLIDRHAADSIATIFNQLLTPIPLATSIAPTSTPPVITPRITITPLPSSTFTPGATLAHTPIQPIATFTQPAAFHTATSVPPIQNTPTQPATPTMVEPEATLSPTETPTALPSLTPIFSPTPPPTATSQPYPPPRTPTPAGYP